MKLKQKKVLMLHMALMVFIAVASFAQSPTQTPGPTPGYVCPKPSMTIELSNNPVRVGDTFTVNIYCYPSIMPMLGDIKLRNNGPDIIRIISNGGSHYQFQAINEGLTVLYADVTIEVGCTNSDGTTIFTMTTVSATASVTVLPADATPTPSPVKGDVNGDDVINIIDALMIAQYAVRFAPTGFIAANADVNCDSIISVVDALIIAQINVGLISAFPC